LDGKVTKEDLNSLSVEVSKASCLTV